MSSTPDDALAAMTAPAKPTRMRGRHRRAVRKAMAEEQTAPEAVQAAATRSRPSRAVLLRESMAAIEAKRARRPRLVEVALPTKRELKAAAAAKALSTPPARSPSPVPTRAAQSSDGRARSDGVRRERGVAREDAFGDGMGARQLTRASTVRERLPYPEGGQHSFTPTDSECRAMRCALRRERTNPGEFVRSAALRAAGVEAAPRRYEGRSSSRINGTVTFELRREERTALDAAMRDRDFGAWVRDAVRAAAGMGQHPWSPCADAALTKGFRRWGLDDLQRALPGRTAGQLYDRAARLGLSRGLTDDRLTLHAAEAVSGYHGRALLALLKEQGVETHVLVGPRSHAVFRRRFVLRVDLERAVRARGATELVEEACHRLARDRETLKRALARLGHVKPRGVRYWRLPSRVLDEAELSIRGDGSTLNAAAARAGVTRPTMRAWLLADGLTNPGAHYHVLDPVAVDALIARRRAMPCHFCGAVGHYSNARRCATAATEVAA